MRNMFTSTKTLIKECGWLTVKQMMVYHSLVQLHKTVQSQMPEYLFNRVSTELHHLDERRKYPYNTRQQVSGILRRLPDSEAKLDLTERSWCWRASRTYQDLPISIRKESKLRLFKNKLRTCVKENVDS